MQTPVYQRLKFLFKFPTGQIIERCHTYQDDQKTSKSTKASFFSEIKTIEIADYDHINYISWSWNTVGITKIKISTKVGKILEIKSKNYKEIQKVCSVDLQKKNKVMIGMKTRFSTHLEFLAIYTTSLQLSQIEVLLTTEKTTNKSLNDAKLTSNRLFKKVDTERELKKFPKAKLSQLNSLNTVNKIKKSRNIKQNLVPIKLAVINERNAQDELIFNINS